LGPVKDIIFMHIPDGYLSPQTYTAAYAVAVPTWVLASRKLNRTLRSRQAPLLALSAAFCFVIMMFNIPFPGGTSGHAVGAVLVAVLLGPWAACVAVTTALVIQAVWFQDGGITCIGANSINMAMIMPFVGYAIYRLIAGSSNATSSRRWIGAAVGGYIGLNVAALSAGVMFGIQPLLFHDAAGRSLYSPYSLRISVPAMCLTHLLAFGIVEALVTGAVVAYIQRTDPSLLYGVSHTEITKTGKTKIGVRLLAGFAALIALSPLGLILPAKLGGGTAWGEWSREEITKLVGYVPSGMTRMSHLWKAPMPDYAFRGQESAPLHALSVSYLVSAIVGVALIVFVVVLIAKGIGRRDNSDPS
jgi:cobalt/nickel transport system permease protein